MFYGKPLYVAIFQRKEERRAKLQQHFAHIARMVGPANSMIPTGYPHVYFAHPSTHLPQGPPRHGFVYPPMGLSHEWRPNMFPSPPNIQQIHSPMVHLLSFFNYFCFIFSPLLMSSYLPYHRCQIRQGITEVTGEGWVGI